MKTTIFCLFVSLVVGGCSWGTWNSKSGSVSGFEVRPDPVSDAKAGYITASGQAKLKKAEAQAGYITAVTKLLPKHPGLALKLPTTLLGAQWTRTENVQTNNNRNDNYYHSTPQPAPAYQSQPGGYANIQSAPLPAEYLNNPNFLALRRGEERARRTMAKK